ncbi:MAG: FAD-dependent oxidoreductase [Planctomycetota bacterium]
MTITEPARAIPVAHDCDCCVIGGSCSGLFAAVRAARRGLRVAVIEHQNRFGGTATAGLVNIWHSLYDTTGERQIVAGLTAEMLDRLERRGAVTRRRRTDADAGAFFNPAELTLELDALIADLPIRPFLHARAVATHGDPDGRIRAVIIEDASGRRAITARQFIDATGNAEVVHRAGLPTWRHAVLQPPTTAALFQGIAAMEHADPTFDLGACVRDPADPDHLERGFLWHSHLPGAEQVSAVFGTRVHGVDCSDADDLTRAEIAGREQIARVTRILARRAERTGELRDPVALLGLASHTGVRATRQAVCRHRLAEHDLLRGRDYPDTVAVATYRVDLHHQGSGGITFRYLDGREQVIDADGRCQNGSWRGPDDPPPATFYRIPYRSMVPMGSANLLVAGRALDADAGAFGAVRVMVCCNQLGEAAGEAAVLACESDGAVGDIDPAALRDRLQGGGSALPAD